MTRAVLFLIFNREDTTQRVFDAIRAARPPRLYVAADGARVGRGEIEADKCRATRAIVLDHIDWPCEIHTLMREENLGCGRAVSEAISWFFEHEDDGIILEDDCLPHPDFFPYCEELLDRYADDPRVAFIGGNNHDFFDKPHDAPSYYFSAYNHVWGWAAWRSTWAVYNYTLADVCSSQYMRATKQLGMTLIERFYWSYLFMRLKTVGFNTWDYQLTMSLHLAGKLSIVPNISMIDNLGFATDATHTTGSNRRYIQRKSRPTLPLTHPEKLERTALYDRRYVWGEIKSRPLIGVKYIYYAARYFFSRKV